MPLDEDTVQPSASGILHCLRALAEEAAALNLLRTFSAIEEALEMACFESARAAELPEASVRAELLDSLSRTEVRLQRR